MDFIKSQFGVEADRLDYGDIVKFFTTSKKEGTNLEFKSNNNDRRIPEKIYQTTCAMLNSSGGIIIWGAPKELKTTDGSKECVGSLTPFKERFGKEDLLRSLSDRIVPIPNGIDIYEIQENEQYLYLFQIQASEYSPHQTDNRYYMRLDTETRVAPHYFVEALFRKVKYPDLSGQIEFMNITFMDKDYHYILIQFKVILKNKSQLQNEEYPDFIISSNVGQPLESYESWPPKEKSILSTIRSAAKPLEILHYGKRIEEIYRLGLHANDISKLNNKKIKLNIFLRFGGRLSPLKYSFYAIDISFFTRMQYCEYQSYVIPTERIELLESRLVADSSFDIEEISDWPSISR
jgi:Putative DNA-binding domain